jgi:hypothetical protein
MPEILNTGVISEEAAQTDVNSEELDTTQPGYEEEATEEEVNFADFFEEESDEEQNVDNEGSDVPPNQTETEEGQQQTQQEAKPAERMLSQAEVDAIVQKRLKQDRDARAREQAAQLRGKTLEQLLEADVEIQAQKLVEENPGITLDLAKTIVRGQQPQVQAQEQQTEVAEDNNETRLQAWKDSWITDEPMIQADMRDPAMTIKNYANKDAVFKSLLVKGVTPFVAHSITKDVRAILQQEIAAAKAKGGQEVINQMKQSNERATTPVTGTKATAGRTKSVAQMIADTPVEKLMEILQNGPVYIGE